MGTWTGGKGHHTLGEDYGGKFMTFWELNHNDTNTNSCSAVSTIFPILHCLCSNMFHLNSYIKCAPVPYHFCIQDHPPTHTQTHTYTLTHSLSPTHSLTHSHTHTHTHTQTQTQTHSLTHTHTHTHSLTHSLT